jgi:hypothetical protein
MFKKYEMSYFHFTMTKIITTAPSKYSNKSMKEAESTVLDSIPTMIEIGPRPN